jgi:hypothetical protein
MAYPFLSTIFAKAGVKVGTPAVDPAAGDVRASGNVSYEGSLVPRRSSVDYTAYAYVVMATPVWVFSSTTFSTTAGATAIAASTLGVPTAAKALNVRLVVKETTPTSATYFSLMPDGNFYDWIVCRPQVANFWVENAGLLNTNGSGSIYYRANTYGTNTMTVTMQVFGYFL